MLKKIYVFFPYPWSKVPRITPAKTRRSLVS